MSNQNDDRSFQKFEHFDGDLQLKCESNIIRIRGLPWSTTKQEICDFFDGVNILNGENGIHLVTLSTNGSKPLGEAYIELASNADYQLARSFHKKHLGTRYIEVFEANYNEFLNIMSKQRNAQDECVVRLRGLPWNATEDNIANFFQGLKISWKNGIHIPQNKNGKSSGEAYVKFETTDDCDRALQRNMNELGHRYIEIFRSTEQQMMQSMVKSTPNGRFNGLNHRMHPYTRNGHNKFDRQTNGRNQTRNNFRGHGNDSYVQNTTTSIKTRFANNDNQFNQYQSNCPFDHNASTGNFYDDFDLNEFAKNVNNFDRPFNARKNTTNFKMDNRNRFGRGNFTTTNRFINESNDRNFIISEESNGQHCIHMRGLPYYTDEMDVFNFFAPLKPSFCKIILNQKGLHSGEAKAYFNSYEQVRNAMGKDRMKMGSRYIELFYGGIN